MFKDLPELETNSKALFCCAFDSNKTKNNNVNKLNPISSKNYPQDAIRPKQVLMSKRKIRDFFGLEIIYWKDSLKKCLKSLTYASNLDND